MNHNLNLFPTSHVCASSGAGRQTLTVHGSRSVRTTEGHLLKRIIMNL